MIIVAVPRGGGRVAIDATRVDCLLRHDAGELFVYWGIGASVFIGPEADWVETEIIDFWTVDRTRPRIVWSDAANKTIPLGRAKPEQT